MGLPRIETTEGCYVSYMLTIIIKKDWYESCIQVRLPCAKTWFKCKIYLHSLLKEHPMHVMNPNFHHQCISMLFLSLSWSLHSFKSLEFTIHQNRCLLTHIGYLSTNPSLQNSCTRCTTGCIRKSVTIEQLYPLLCHSLKRIGNNAVTFTYGALFTQWFVQTNIITIPRRMLAVKVYLMGA